MQENSYLKEVVHRAVANPLVVPATSALGLVVTIAAQAPAVVGQIASAIAGAGLLALEARKEWKANRSRTESNEFFFYYQASNLLTKQRKRLRPKRQP